jgi:SAM-dependent methyltransferase
MAPLSLRKIVLLMPFNPRHMIYKALTNNKPLKSFIDVACGHGGNGVVTRAYNKHAQIVGVDIFKPYIQECKKLNVYDDFVLADVRHLPIKEGAFDGLIFTDAIEHIEKKQATQALAYIEKVAANKIITTSNGLILRSEEEIHDHNDYQMHLSGWVPQEFVERGYDVWGRFPKYIASKNMLPILVTPFCIFNCLRLPFCISHNFVALRNN